MIVLNAAETLRGVASVATQLTYTVFGMELASGVETYKVLAQGQLPSSAGTLYTTPGSTQGFIKSIHVVNNDSAARTFQLFANGTAAANAITPAITLGIGGFAVYGEHGWRIYSSTGEVQSVSNPAKIVHIFQGTTTYTPTAGAKALFVEMVGGGGGGGSNTDAATNSSGGSGGGGGAYSAVLLTTLKASYTVQVGAGGAGATAGNSNAGTGTDSTFDSPSVCTAKGGAGAATDTVNTIHAGPVGGAGGLASSGVGDIKIDGEAGDIGVALAAAQAVGGKGGNSKFGAGGAGRVTEAAGNAAVGYGGGGGGAVELSGATARDGGAGANGLIRVWEYF